MFQFPDNPYPGDEYVYGGILYEFNGYGWDRQRQDEASMPDTAPPSDGDKGDITVSGGGYIWMLDPAVVTAAGRALIDDADAAAQRVTLGLGNVNNTPDASKPISAATQAALNLKYDKAGGTISGNATVTGFMAVQADLYVSNGRIVNFGAEGSPERSYLFFNQSGSKSLYNDGISLGFYGTPVKVHNTVNTGSPTTGAFTVAGGVGIGGHLQVGGSVTVAGTMTVVGQTVTRNLANVDGVMWNYGYGVGGDQSVIYWNASGSKYIHNNGALWNFVGQKVNFADLTDVSSPAAAAVCIAGGLGVAKGVQSGGTVKGAVLQSTGFTFAGSSGTHYLGPADANTEYHVYASGHYWSYNRSNGNLVWSNGSGPGFIVYDSGWVHAQAGFTTPGPINASGLGTFGSLTTGSATVNGALTVNGTLTGAIINGTDISASGVLKAGANVAAYNDTYYGFYQAGGYRYQYFASNFYWLYNQSAGDLMWTGPGGQVYANFRNDAAFILAFQKAYMPGGGPWGDSSDERIKNVQGDYTLGLDEIRQLQPVRYSFKGNDTAAPPAARVALPGKEQMPAPKSAPYPNSPHYGVAMDMQVFVGLIAQEVETVLPGMVTQREGFIDGQPVTDLRDLNTSELIFALVNAVKTLAARVEALEAPV